MSFSSCQSLFYWSYLFFILFSLSFISLVVFFSILIYLFLHSPWNSADQNTGIPSPGDLPNPETEPISPALRADSLPAEPWGFFFSFLFFFFSGLFSQSILILVLWFLCWDLAVCELWRSLCLCVCAQLYLTLCNSMDCSSSGFSVCGIFRVWILEQVAISYLRGSSRPRDRTCISCIGRWILYHCSAGNSIIVPYLVVILIIVSYMVVILCVSLWTYIVNMFGLFLS